MREDDPVELAPAVVVEVRRVAVGSRESVAGEQGQRIGDALEDDDVATIRRARDAGNVEEEAGGSYTIFKNLSSADLNTAGLGTIEVKNRAAFLVNPGVDVRLTSRVGFLVDGRYTFLRPTSRGASGADQELTLDPLEIAAGFRIGF